MKFILFIQTIIIIVGGYYLYILWSRSESVTNEESVRMIEIPPVTSTTTDNVRLNQTATTSVDFETSNLPHDAGMEWPIPDEGIELQ